MNYYDLIILGGGPTGVTAVLRATELGAKVALIEKSTMGGTCTNDGCVPTRVLAKAARLMRDTNQFADYGISAASPTLDFQQLLNRTQQTVYRIHEKKQLADHLRESGIDLFTQVGQTTFLDPHTIQMKNGRQLTAEKFIICVGGRARRLTFPGAEHALTHSDVWRMKTLPKSIAIIGAAATGCQLASVFQDFGSKVSLLDAAPRILPAEDEDVSDAVCQAFYDQGINVEIGIGFDTRIEKKNNSYILSYSKDGEPKQLEVGAIILAVGWQGNIDGLDLEKAAVQHQKSYILVDDYLQTTAPNIYAAGDITGRMMLVQSGQYEARIAAENALLDTPTKFEHQIVPHGGFTDPEYASVGRSQSQISPTTNTITATIPYSSLDRAVIDGHTAGFCKLIVDTDTNQILGAHVVGEQANEIVHVIAAGMAANMRIEQLAHLEIAYPTFTGIIGLAARQIVNQLGQTPLTLEWRTLAPNTAEWERSANFG